MKKLQIEIKNVNTIKIMFIIFIILLALPSIIYMLTGNKILDLNPDYIYNIVENNRNNLINALIYLGIMTLISITYILILKKYKEIFKNNKDIIKFVTIVSVLFMLILPMTSTDIFYYIATGWSDAKYKINPYYTSVYELKQSNEIQNDEILQKMPEFWEQQKIVYGPFWTLVSKLLASLSFGNLTLALFIFKIFNLCLHLLNCKLIHKLTNKKILMLIYALNPLVLFESITNVHNDILLVFFILLSLYFAIKKKNIVLSIIALSIATAVKYVAVLLAPFLVIWYYRNEKISKRILNALWLALIFLIVLCGIYLIYTRDVQVLQGIITQQGKYAKSLLLIIDLIFNYKIANTVKLIFTIIFASIYLIEIFANLFKKKVSLRDNLRISYTMILRLLLLVITNFQVWYIIWLMPLIMWQNKKIIKSTINLTITAELASTIFFAFGEGYIYGTYFFALMVILWFIFNKININKFIEIKI